MVRTVKYFAELKQSIERCRRAIQVARQLYIYKKGICTFDHIYTGILTSGVVICRIGIIVSVIGDIND